MSEISSDVIQAEVRQGQLKWALLPLAIAGCIIAFVEVETRPLIPFFLGMLALTVVGLVWELLERQRLAAWLMNLGSILILTGAWHWFPTAPIYLALSLPILMTALTLNWRECLLITILTNLVLVSGTWLPAVPVLEKGQILITSSVLWITAYLGCISQRPQRQMIAWAWRGYDQAQRHLDTARQRQQELHQALDDLARANRQTVRMNDLLTSARRAVEQARQAKEEFVANVSHELRTPLNMIIGFSDMILDAPEVYDQVLPPELMADVAAIKRNSKHLSGLVDDVLDLAEADTGYMHIFQETTSLPEIIGEAVEAVSALFESKGLTLDTHIEADLPDLYCDRTRIRQVIINLLSNAGRFTEHGGATVTAEHNAQKVRIKVIDTGTGVEPTKLARLFEPFQQADQSIRRRYGGTGLGLSISKRFIEMHGGRIWLESEVGRGTTAIFTLPLQPDVARNDSERWLTPYNAFVARSEPSHAPHTHVRPCVIVLEAQDALYHLVQRHIDDLDAVLTHTVPEARRAIADNAAIAVLINEATPSLDSQVAARLGDLAFDIPIISCWVPGRQTAITNMGVQDYLIKPVSKDDLIKSIQRVAPEAQTMVLADDDADARQLFGRLLASMERGYRVIDAEDGLETLQLLRQEHPDLLLLDLVMPNQDGFAVIEQKAADDEIRDIPVVILSAQDPDQDPIISKQLVVTRQHGLSTRDLMASIRAMVPALRPRFGVGEHPETPGGSSAF